MHSGSHHARRATKGKKRVRFCVREAKSVMTPEQNEQWKKSLLLEAEKKIKA